MWRRAGHGQPLGVPTLHLLRQPGVALRIGKIRQDQRCQFFWRGNTGQTALRAAFRVIIPLVVGLQLPQVADIDIGRQLAQVAHECAVLARRIERRVADIGREELVGIRAADLVQGLAIKSERERHTIWQVAAQCGAHTLAGVHSPTPSLAINSI